MRRPIAALALGLLVGAAPLRAQDARCAPARTALVLSGGGSKGIAHLGVLQVLDSLGIVPDLIVGTSMGALVGALYANGETADQVRARLATMPFDQLIRRYEPIVSASFGALKPALVWEKVSGRWVLQTGAVREAEVSAAVARVTLRANLTARGDFDRLPIPFRAVATDLRSRQVVPLATGDLGLALRASMAIPLIIRPAMIDGRSLVDGGLSSNVPVGVARALGAERVIVSRLAVAKPDPNAFDDPLSVTSQLLEFLWVQDSISPRDGDVLIESPAQEFGNLDFRPETSDSLIRMGRRAAEAAFGAARCVRTLHSGRPRPGLPAIAARTGRVATDTAVHAGDLLLRDLQLSSGDTLDIGALSQGLRRFASQERYRGLWLHPTGDSAKLDFDVAVEEAPARTFGLGVAFDNTMSGRIWIAAVDRAMGDGTIEGSSLLTVGSYRSDLTLGARRQSRLGRRGGVPFGANMQLLSERVRLWDGATELPSQQVEEFGFSLGLSPLYEPGWSHELGVDFRLWQERGIRERGTVGPHYALRYRERGHPTPSVSFELIGLRHWQRASLDLAASQTVGKLEIRPHVRAGWGRDLPVHQTFTLGGLDGFAGLRLLEQRGDRELFGALLLRWPIWRSLRARFEPMAGMTGVGDFFSGPGELDGVLLIGARAGIDLDTPIGPIRIEEGFNNRDRRQALVRVGLWF